MSHTSWLVTVIFKILVRRCALIIPELGKQRWVDPWYLLATQLCLLNELRCQLEHKVLLLPFKEAMWTGNTDVSVSSIQMICEAVRAGEITTDKLSDSDAHNIGNSGAEDKPAEVSPPPLPFSHLLELAMGQVKRGHILSVPWDWLCCGKDVH